MSVLTRQTQTRHHPQGKTCHHFQFHGLSCDEYDDMLRRANRMCELCGTPEEETGGQRLVVDHFEGNDPPVRFIRGLVCDRCNAVMSCLDETKVWGKNVAWRARAIEYEANSWEPVTSEQRHRAALNREERQQQRERIRRLTALEAS
ncbi:endonuclease domain-containing protein [Streptomyces xiamenensis]|uniref:endonuclease domain-containing protein n=1 Tax=Streptomyces xiamenensis TaxID=408015 RepID=UPI003D75BE38